LEVFNLRWHLVLADEQLEPDVPGHIINKEYSTRHTQGMPQTIEKSQFIKETPNPPKYMSDAVALNL
jgi:hypothetical protein